MKTDIITVTDTDSCSQEPVLDGQAQTTVSYFYLSQNTFYVIVYILCCKSLILWYIHNFTAHFYETVVVEEVEAELCKVRQRRIAVTEDTRRGATWCLAIPSGQRANRGSTCNNLTAGLPHSGSWGRFLQQCFGSDEPESCCQVPSRPARPRHGVRHSRQALVRHNR